MSDWEKVAEFERGGFTIRIETMLDDTPDLSWLGEYSSGRPSFPYWDRAAGMLVYNERTWREAEKAAEENGIDRSEHRFIGGFQHGPGDGVTARQAYRYCRQDAERLEAYNRGDWHMLGVRAVVSLAGVELGESGGIWGVESDSSEDYIVEVGEDEAGEAISKAREKLEEIVKLHLESGKAVAVTVVPR